MTSHEYETLMHFLERMDGNFEALRKDLQHLAETAILDRTTFGNFHEWFKGHYAECKAGRVKASDRKWDTRLILYTGGVTLVVWFATTYLSRLVP